MLVLKDSLVTLDTGDEHIDVAGADVLTVEFVTSLLDIVLRGKENKASASLSSEALLQVDVFLLNLNVTEELDHLGLGDVARHAAELDALWQVVLIENPLQVDTDAAELVVHE